MRDGQAVKHATPRLIVDDTVVQHVTCAGVDVVGVSDFRASMVSSDGSGPAPTLVDQEVLAVLVSSGVADTLTADADLMALLEAGQIPMRDIGVNPSPADVLSLALSILSERYAEQQHFAASDQRTLAQLRRQHMQIQDDYAELETWVWDNLAPKQVVVRNWPATAGFVTLADGDERIRQPLPAPVRGFVAIDVHIAESAPAGLLRMQCTRPVGGPFAKLEVSQHITADTHGWVSLQLPRAAGGPPQDVVVELSFRPDAPEAGGIKLSLAPDSPFPDYCLEQGGTRQPSPLALRVRRTLPRMPTAPAHDNHTALPADGVTRIVRPNDLSEVTRLRYYKTQMRRVLRRYPDNPVVASRPEQNAVLVQPSVHKPVGALIEGVKVESLRQARGIIQNSRHDTMEIAFALGVAPSGTVKSVEEALAHIGPWVHLLPAEWGEVWCDLETPITGLADLLLVTAMPNMPFNRNAEALFHGFRLTGGAWPTEGAQ